MLNYVKNQPLTSPSKELSYRDFVGTGGNNTPVGNLQSGYLVVDINNTSIKLKY